MASKKFLIKKSFAFDDNGEKSYIRKVVDGKQNIQALSGEALKVGKKCKAIEEIK